jgi:hypothetical protein
MARWKLTAKHYIYAEQYGQPTEWERQETNTDTGRMFRRAYKVPMYIDPDDRFCINPHEGICVVARKGTEHPGDIVFFGPPTADMEPLDDGARAETEAERHRWINPIEGLEPTIGADFGKQMLEMLERQLDAATAGRSAPRSDDLQALKDMIAAQQKQIEALMQAPIAAVEPIPTDDPPVEPNIALKDIDPDALPAPPPIRVDRPKSALRRH